MGRVTRQDRSVRIGVFSKAKSRTWSLLGILLILAISLYPASAPVTVFAQASPEVVFYGNSEYPPFEVSGTGDVSLYLGVRGADGFSVKLDDQKPNLKITEDNAPIADFTITPDVSPLAVVVAIDTSNSMLELDGGQSSRLDRARSAAAEFIKSLPQPVLVAVTTFNNLSTNFQAFPKPGEQITTLQISQRLRDTSIPTGGSGTCLYDGVGNAVSLLKSVSGARSKAVVVLTDGRDEIRVGGNIGGKCSASDVDSVVRSANDINAQIFSLGLGGDADVAALDRLSTNTSGQSTQVYNNSDLGAAYDVIRQKLGGHYVVKYSTPSNNKSAQVRVQLDLGNGQAPSGSQLVLIPPLTPDLTGIAPSLVVSGTTNTVQGVIDLVPVIAHPNRIGKMEYYNKDTNTLIGSGAAPDWRLKGWDTNTLAKDGPQAGTSVNIEARAFNANSSGAPTLASTTLTALPVPLEIDWTKYVLFGIGAVAILTLLLTLFLFLNRGRGGVMAARGKPASVTKGEPLAQLIIVEGPGISKPQEHFLYGDRSVGLGRDEDMPIQLPGERVSRQHGEILYRRNQFLYVETKATNGTEIDGQPVQRDTPVPLRDGGEFNFGGQTRAIFRLRQAGAVAAQAGLIPPAQQSLPPRSMPQPVASELHTTEWVRETPLQSTGTPPQYAPGGVQGQGPNDGRPGQ
jgi:hypothetical protein